MIIARLAALGCTAGLALVVTAGAAAQATSPTSAATTHRLVFVDHTGPTTFNDVGKNGFSVGDTFTFSESVTQNGKRVGFAGGFCTEIRVTRESNSQQCLVTASLPAGQFTLQGIATYSASSPNTGTVTYAITGGTGTYRTARGQVTVTPLSDADDRIIVDITTN